MCHSPDRCLQEKLSCPVAGLEWMLSAPGGNRRDAVVGAAGGHGHAGHVVLLWPSATIPSGFVGLTAFVPPSPS